MVNPFDLLAGIATRDCLESFNAVVQQFLAALRLLLARWQDQVLVELFESD